ncbi:uncharacterized protein LOC134727130 [Mytilus trossulus]|uniref:uncharacterized protein LOC134727128 n=1 Tax=Mytilus trossulus TaxID=6551 RepID=UPI0030067C10
MIVLIVTLALVVGTQAQICCVPAQWEGTEGTIIAVSQNDTADPMIVTGAISVAYDATNKRIAAMLYMSTGGYNGNVGVILNYAQGIQYTVSGNNCTRTPLGAFVPNCIPSDAKLQRSSYMGPPSNKMMINSYTYMRGPLEVGVTVTANTCVPVGELINGQTPNEFVIQSVGFSNITPGISKADSFTPPSSCLNSPLVQANLIPMQGRLLRRYLDLLP